MIMVADMADCNLKIAILYCIASHFIITPTVFSLTRWNSLTILTVIIKVEIRRQGSNCLNDNKIANLEALDYLGN